MIIILTVIELLNSMSELFNSVSDVMNQANDFLENLTFLELLLSKNKQDTKNIKDKKN